MSIEVDRSCSISYRARSGHIEGYRGHIEGISGDIEGLEQCRNDIRMYSGVLKEFQSLEHDVDLSMGVGIQQGMTRTGPIQQRGDDQQRDWQGSEHHHNGMMRTGMGMG